MFLFVRRSMTNLWITNEKKGVNSKDWQRNVSSGTLLYISCAVYSQRVRRQLSQFFNIHSFHYILQMCFYKRNFWLKCCSCFFWFSAKCRKNLTFLKLSSRMFIDFRIPQGNTSLFSNFHQKFSEANTLEGHWNTEICHKYIIKYLFSLRMFFLENSNLTIQAAESVCNCYYQALTRKLWLACKILKS